MVANALPNARSNPTRAFGRFELRQLLGKSTGTMVWLAFDPQSNSEVVLTLPRVQPVEPGELESWLRDVRSGARLSHPHLAPAIEVGVQDHWPYIVVDRKAGVTLTEWAALHPSAKPTEIVALICDLLRGLAFALEAGVAHRDLQFHSALVSERGKVTLLGLAGSGSRRALPNARPGSNDRSMAMDPSELRAQRNAASRDLLACGILLHHLLAGQPALDQADTALVMERMSPLGRELVRLPWSTPMPIPEALRAIVNRCTSGQERLRYQNVRTLLGALSGWLETESAEGGGPIALLLGRLQSVGHLPALPGLAARVARVTSLESQRTDEIADQVLSDMALSFELLRTLNSAHVQGTQVQGNGPVLTLRRIISLIGVNGVRLAANTLRPWPGPLSATQATAMEALLYRVRLAGHTAQALRPKGYDAQVVYLITVLQNLGRLMLGYHFADEAEQIQQLVKPHPANREAGTPEQPGLTEEAAGFAVLGVDVESLGIAVARHWGLSEEVMHMARRLPPEANVRKPDSDAEMLRLTACAANDAADSAELQPGARSAAAMGRIAQRYGRALGISARDVADALRDAREALHEGSTMPAARDDAAPQAATPDGPAAARTLVSETAGRTSPGPRLAPR